MLDNEWIRADENPIHAEWSEAKFPFDMAECGACITQHVTLDLCDNPKHIELSREARILDRAFVLVADGVRSRVYSPEFKAAVLALRIKYKSLFPDAIPERA